MTTRFRTAGLLAGLLLAPALGAAQDSKSYVITAAGWGDAQAEAVRRAGGAVIYASPDAGIATAESRSATFLADARKSSALLTVDEDRVVQWQRPVPHVEIGEAVASAGDDETFWNVQWAPRAISAPEAWNAGCRGAGARVAILDGGLHGAHVDLDAQIDVARSVSFVAGQAWNTDLGTFWHGTHVAGIVAAEDNGIGTIGIAPDATLIGVKVLHGGSGSFGAVISGILYAATPVEQGGGGADIINMSLGAVMPKNEAQGLTNAMARAVNYAASRGVLVISATGNDGIDLDHAGSYFATPAQSGSGIAVSSTGPTGYAIGYPDGATNFAAFAAYSNFGASAVWVAGPGGNPAIFATAAGQAPCSIPVVGGGSVGAPCGVFDWVINTSRGGGASVSSYSFAYGTSMAAPAVAGVAALIKANSPGISLGALKSAVARATDDEGKTGRDARYGNGFINAYKACTQ